MHHYTYFSGMNLPRKKFLFAAIWMFFSQLLFAHPVLIPYQKSGVWGLYDSGKHPVVKPQYLWIEFEFPYYFCLNKQQTRYDIYNSSGVKLDTCQFYESTDSARFLIFKGISQAADSQVKIREAKNGLFRNESLLQPLNVPCLMYELYQQKIYSLCDEAVCFIQLREKKPFAEKQFFRYAITQKKDAYGLFDYREKKYIFPPSCSEVSIIAPSWFYAMQTNGQAVLFNLRGSSLPVIAEYAQAVNIDPENGNYVLERKNRDRIPREGAYLASVEYEYELRTPQEKIIIPFNNNWHYFPDDHTHHLIRITHQVPGERRWFSLLNLKGDTVLPFCHEMESLLMDHLFKISQINDEKHRIECLGIFNTTLEKFIWENPTHEYRSIETRYGLPAVKYGDTLLVMNDLGRVLFHRVPHNTFRQASNDEIKYIRIYRDSMLELNIFNSAHFYAIKKVNTTGYEVYDQKFHLLADFDDICELSNGSSFYFGAHSHKGWGIYDAKMALLGNQFWDSVSYERDYYSVWENGAMKRMLKSNKQWIPGYDYSKTSHYAIDGQFLAEKIEIRNGTKRSTLHWIDSNGHIRHQLLRNEKNKKYAFISGANVLEYPDREQTADSVRVLDFNGNSIQSRYVFFNKIEAENYIDPFPICFSARDKNGLLQLYDVYTLNIIPIKQKRFYGFTHPIIFSNEKGESVHGLLIEEIDEQDERSVTGYYTESGKCFWE